jgi:hypothetical protein
VRRALCDPTRQQRPVNPVRLATTAMQPADVALQKCDQERCDEVGQFLGFAKLIKSLVEDGHQLEAKQRLDAGKNHPRFFDRFARHLLGLLIRSFLLGVWPIQHGLRSFEHWSH